MKREMRARLKRAQDALDRLLYEMAGNGALRKGLTEGVREARDAMSEDDRERLDAEVERTIAACGIRDARGAH
jgi:hypothetical protein